MCISQSSAEKWDQCNVCVHVCEQIYYKKLTHSIMQVGKHEALKGESKARDSGEPCLALV